MPVTDGDSPDAPPSHLRWPCPAVALVLILIVGGWWFFNRTQATGDTGGKVLNQLPVGTCCFGPPWLWNAQAAMGQQSKHFAGSSDHERTEAGQL